MSDSPTTAHTRLELPIDIIRIQALLPHRYPFYWSTEYWN